MRILVLGPNLERLTDIIGDHDVEVTHERLQASEIHEAKPDLLLSYGYRYLLPKDALRAVGGRAINMHISLLPWNRGADPSFWSWLQKTPKGVSIHWMSEQLDQGNLLAQSEVALSRDDSLSETYEVLQSSVCHLLSQVWPDVEAGTAPSHKQPRGGSYHNVVDKDPYLSLLDRGWDTACRVLEDHGRERGLWVSQ